MRHRHPGSYTSRTKKGNTVFKKRPIHSHKLFLKKYQPIVDRAKAKGYKVFDLDRLQSTVDEVDIPESYRTDGLIVPDTEGKQRRDLIFIDDDAKEEYKQRAFAHELGHQHLFATGQDEEEADDHTANIPAIERKADKIGADILDMSVKEFNSPDVTYKDVVSKKRNFIQSLFHAGNEPPSEKLAKGEPVFGFSSKEFADAWADKLGYDDVYQFQTSDYKLDEKQYARDRDSKKVLSDNEFIARNVLKEEELD